jgi:hypothetical protein
LSILARVLVTLARDKLAVGTRTALDSSLTLHRCVVFISFADCVGFRATRSHLLTIRALATLVTHVVDKPGARRLQVLALLARTAKFTLPVSISIAICGIQAASKQSKVAARAQRVSFSIRDTVDDAFTTAFRARTAQSVLARLHVTLASSKLAIGAAPTLDGCLNNCHALGVVIVATFRNNLFVVAAHTDGTQETKYMT